MQADRAVILKGDGMKVKVHGKCPNYRDCCTAAHRVSVSVWNASCRVFCVMTYTCVHVVLMMSKAKWYSADHKAGKAVPLQAQKGPEGSSKLRFPDFVTTAQDGGKVVGLKHRPLYQQEILLVLISVRG